jgi:hypothetical protein
MADNAKPASGCTGPSCCSVFAVEGVMGACAGFGIMALVGWHPVGVLFGAMLGAAHVWAVNAMWQMDHPEPNAVNHQQEEANRE